MDEIIKKFYYDGSRYYLDTANHFVPMDVQSVKRHVKLTCIAREDIDPIINAIQVNQFIQFAGALAGYQRGLYEISGQKVLVTSSPKIIKASKGQWKTLEGLFRGLLDGVDGDDTQTMVFLAWLKFARESLLAKSYRPGQMLALCGEKGCGKSLLIDVIDAALGGRRANPYNCWTDRTQFNFDLAGAELLAVDDECGSNDIRARKQLAAAIKSNLFAGAVRIEAKHRQPFTCRPKWRMVMALNDDTESLTVLPPLSEIKDKTTLFQCHKRPLPMPAHTMQEREAFFSRLMDEIPALLDFLERWDVPSELREIRCGVKSFHSPEILRSINSVSPEYHLIDLIDSAAKAGKLALPWQGSAASLRAILMQNSRDAERLLGGWVQACGTYLGKLEGTRTKRLTVREGVQQWLVLPDETVERCH